MKYPRKGFLFRKYIKIQYNGNEGEKTVELEATKATNEAHEGTLVLDSTPIGTEYLLRCETLDKWDEIEIISPVINFNGNVITSGGNATHAATLNYHAVDMEGNPGLYGSHQVRFNMEHLHD